MKFTMTAAAIAACVVLCDAQQPVAKKDAFFGTATPLEVGAAEAKWLALTKQERVVTLAATCENEWKEFCPEEWKDAAPVFQGMYDNLVLIAEEKAAYKQEMAERKAKGGKEGEGKSRSLRAPADGSKPGKGKKGKKGGKGQHSHAPQGTSGAVKEAPPTKDGDKKNAAPANKRGHGKCPRAIVGKAMRCFYDKAFDETNQAKVSVDCKVGLVANKVAMARDEREREQDPHNGMVAWNYNATGLVFFLFCAIVGALTATCCCLVRKCCLRGRAVRQEQTVLVDVEHNQDQVKGTPVVVIAQDNVPFGVEVKEVALLA